MRRPAHLLLLLFLGGDDREAATALTRLVTGLVATRPGLARMCLVTTAIDLVPPPGPGVEVLRDPAGAVHRRYGAERGAIYLVRPDGYIGFRSLTANTAALEAHLTRVYGPAAGSAA